MKKAQRSIFNLRWFILVGITSILTGCATYNSPFSGCMGSPTRLYRLEDGSFTTNPYDAALGVKKPTNISSRDMGFGVNEPHYRPIVDRRSD